MTPELVGILGVGAALFVGLGGLTLALWREVRGDVQELRGEMQELRGEMRGEMQGLRGEVHGEMQGLHGEMQGLRSELRGEMQELRAELRAGLSELREELAELRVDIRSLEQRVSRLEGVLEGLIVGLGNGRARPHSQSPGSPTEGS